MITKKQKLIMDLEFYKEHYKILNDSISQFIKRIDEFIFYLKREEKVRKYQLSEKLITDEEYRVFEIARKGKIKMLLEFKEILIK